MDLETNAYACAEVRCGFWTLTPDRGSEPRDSANQNIRKSKGGRDVKGPNCLVVDPHRCPVGHPRGCRDERQGKGGARSGRSRLQSHARTGHADEPEEREAG